MTQTNTQQEIIKTECELFHVQKIFRNGKSPTIIIELTGGNVL